MTHRQKYLDWCSEMDMNPAKEAEHFLNQADDEIKRLNFELKKKAIVSHVSDMKQQFENPSFKDSLDLVMGEVAGIILDKNRKYGNSALEPKRIFSNADPVEQIKVRIDDKLSRIQNQQSDDDEDAEFDLLGYLVLLRIARKQA